MNEHVIFIVQPYLAKPHRLLAQPAQIYDDETEARRAGGRLARFRAGVVVLSQAIDPVTQAKAVPRPLAIHGQVPQAWTGLAKAA